MATDTFTQSDYIGTIAAIVTPALLTPGSASLVASAFAIGGTLLILSGGG